MAGEGDNDSTARLEAAMTSLLKKQDGDHSLVILKLLEENYGLRGDKRVLKDKLEKAEAGVPEGSVVLTGDDVVMFDGFKELGKLEEVKTLVGQVPELQGELDKRDYAVLVGKAAEAVSFNATVLGDLVGAKGLTIEMKQVEVEIEKDGKKEKVKENRPFVKAGEKGELTDLKLFAESNLKDHLPSLTNVEAGNEQDPGRRVPPQHKSPSTPEASRLKGDAAVATKKVAGQYLSPSQRAKKEKE